MPDAPRVPRIARVLASRDRAAHLGHIAPGDMLVPVRTALPGARAEPLGLRLVEFEHSPRRGVERKAIEFRQRREETDTDHRIADADEFPRLARGGERARARPIECHREEVVRLEGLPTPAVARVRPQQRRPAAGVHAHRMRRAPFDGRLLRTDEPDIDLRVNAGCEITK